MSINFPIQLPLELLQHLILGLRSIREARYAIVAAFGLQVYEWIAT